MTEYEKLISGQHYDGRDKGCWAKQSKAKNLAVKFNNLDYNNSEEHFKILKEMLGFLGEDADILAPFNCDYGIHISLGKGSFVNYNCSFLDTGYIEIGEYVMIAPDVKIYTATHPVTSDERYYIDENGKKFWKTSAKKVTIGNNVWIGGGAVICPGVTIGDICPGVTIGENTTIGAGSVVTKDIPANVIAAGNPCKVIREIK